MHTQVRAQVNVKALIIIGVVVVLVGGGVVGGYFYRKHTIKERALAEGNAAYAKGDWAEASRAYRIYLQKVESEDVEILAKYADALLRIEPLEIDSVIGAISAVNKLVRFRPDDDKAFKQLVMLHTATEDFDNIVRVAQRRQHEKPGDPLATIALAQSLIAKLRQDEARRELTNLVEAGVTRPEDAKPYAEACRLLSALDFEAPTPAQRAAAGQWLDRAVERFPDLPEVWLNRARLTRMQAAFNPRGDRAERQARIRADLERAEALNASLERAENP